MTFYNDTSKLNRDNFYVQGVNGPVVTVRGDGGLSMLEMVLIGKDSLIGEVVSVKDDTTTVQVYESTTGLSCGEIVKRTGAPMTIKLGPGLLHNIFDGIARPLLAIEKQAGEFIPAGINISSLDPDAKWKVTIKVKVGDFLNGGDIFAECDEHGITHKSMVMPNLKGKVVFVAQDGEYTVDQTLVELLDENGVKTALTLAQKWPIRTPRPVRSNMKISRPLVTGQRVIDTLFPLGKGGCAGVPGPFGAGKTIIQHQLAKWSDADIIIYLGCGERGNEMTQALEEFSSLEDPKTGRPLLNRTVLIANTSNMPVAAREASIYTGMTIAEYYRDMGYHVALMADSTSRWAEALREISGRLEEMPAEEGFPAYLPSRLAEFYERAGYMKNLNGTEGSVTAIGAVSPQGGDFSEPITQTTKRFVRCFWALDRELAYARHFPSVNWINSYSEYIGDLSLWYEEKFGPKFFRNRGRILELLMKESELLEIVKLIGSDVLPEDQKLTLECAAAVRIGFLQQDAYSKIDTFVSIEKQEKMMELILRLYDGGLRIVEKNIPVSQLVKTGIFETVIKCKYQIPNDKLDMFDDYNSKIDDSVARVLSDNARVG